ncbi:MAG: TlpA disulfide reductase family protein [Bacteroidota bacterium]
MKPILPPFLLSLISLLFFACNQDSIRQADIPSEIILIFEQTQVNNKEIKGEYMDDHEIVQQFSPDSSLAQDTIILSCGDAQKEVVLFQGRFDLLTYLFQKGDTVLISYEGIKPYASILNRQDSAYLVNYDLLWRERLAPDSFPAFRQSALLIYLNMPQESRSSDDMIEIVNQIAEDIQAKTLSQLTEEIQLLDSLKEKGAIPDDIYRYRKSKAHFQAKGKELEASIQCFSRFETKEPLKKEDVAIYETADGLKLPVFSNVLGAEYDSLLSMQAYRELIRRYHAYYGRKVKRVTERHDHNGMPGALINHPDYLERYDSIEQTPVFSDAAKRLMLQWELENIIKHKSVKEKERYLRRFESRFADSAIMQQLQNTYAIQLLDTGNREPDLELVSSDGQTILYQDLLHQYKGKVIYVDFWSSSCRPCIGEIPDGHKLKQAYQNMDVVFVYISLDSKKENWATACKLYELYQSSYWIKNKFTSSEFEQLNVKWIPHYMIYDREGKLAIPYATRPSEAETIGFLDRYVQN